MRYNMDYKFYGWNTPEVKPINKKYNKIKNQRDLYDILSTIWCKDTCAPRMQDRWTSDNKTLGQCSITAFLVQDIFGGDVYGVRLDDGNYHCYNIVNGIKFDFFVLLLVNLQVVFLVLPPMLEVIPVVNLGLFIFFKIEEKLLKFSYQRTWEKNANDLPDAVVRIIVS